MKFIKILPILLCVFYLAGCQVSENEDVDMSYKQEILEEYITETHNTDIIEEITMQKTDESESKSQEDMQNDEKEIKLPEKDSNESDSIEKIKEYMIPEQSFDVFLADWGDVTFVSCKPSDEPNDRKDASFYLIKEDQILYKLPYSFENNSSRGSIGLFKSVGAVAFRDLNDDQKDDIIIITYYVSGAEPTDMVPRSGVTIYLAGENEFYLAEDMIVAVEEHIVEKDRTIQKICDFLQLEKERILQEQWQASYRDIICNRDEILANPYGLRKGTEDYFYIGIHDFDDNNVPELIIGDIVSVAIFTYENNTSKKIADLFEPVDWGGINGLHFIDNKLFLESDGSDGSGYVGFTYDKGEYLTGIYDDYSPDRAYINEKKVSGEEFRQLFNLTEFVQGKNIKSIKRPENCSIERIKIEQENKGTLIIKGEEVEIENLDFSILLY